METHQGYIEWSLWTVSSFVFFMIGVHGGGAGALLLLLASVPYIVIVLRFGELKGALSAIATVTSLMVFTNISLAFVYTLNVALLGFGLGFISRRLDRSVSFLASGTLFSLCCKGLFLALVAFLHDGKFLTELYDALRLQLESEAMASLLPKDPTARKEMIQQLLREIRMGLPGAMIIFSAIEVFALSQMASTILKRSGLPPVCDIPPLSSWSFPRSIVFALFVALIAGMVAEGRSQDYLFLEYLGLNLRHVVLFLLYLQGIAVFWYYAETRSIPLFLRVLLILFTLVTPISAQLVAMLGLVDVSWNFRARIRGKQQ